MRTALVRTGKGASFRPRSGDVDVDEPDLAAVAFALVE
jgi:hypothetical protein